MKMLSALFAACVVALASQPTNASEPEAEPTPEIGPNAEAVVEPAPEPGGEEGSEEPAVVDEKPAPEEMEQMAPAEPPPAPSEPPPAPSEPSSAAEQVHVGPLLSNQGRFGVLTFTMQAAGSVEQTSEITVDADGETFGAGSLIQTRLVPALTWYSHKWLRPFVVKAELEGDVLSGPAWSEPSLDGDGYPGNGEAQTVIRKANLTLSFAGRLNLTGGYMTSHWGLGLVANDGAHRWTPGSAGFTQPEGGDRVLRAMISVAPIPGVPLLVAAARDQVVEDDALLDGDEAQQWIGAVRYGDPGQRTSGGLYVVSRHQESRDGKETNVNVADATVRTRIDLGRMGLDLAGEVAMIQGGTELGPTADHLEHDMLSLGGVLRAGLDLGTWGGVLDAIYASGDGNLDDATLNAFKADRNFHQGLLLYRKVLASQTARAPHTASDPDLSGVPSPDLERIPTYGAVTNSVAFFPRLWWRPVGGLEIYGGPLVALSESGLADPLQTRLNGGVATNAFGGVPGSLLGTEIDLGLRFHSSMEGAEFSVGLEGGVLLPGTAFVDPDGQSMEPVMGARALVEGRI